MKIFRGIDNLPSFKNAVITIGSFDGVHRGHQKLIRQINDLAQEINGESTIITFDPHPRKIIFPKDNSLQLITTLEEKLALFERFNVDNVVVVPFSIEFSQQTHQEYVESFLLNTFNPRFIVIGYDHRFGVNRIGDFTFLKSYEKEGVLDIIEVEKQAVDQIAISSTKVREALNQGNITNATTFLNHEYTLSGKVIKGDQIGRSIGYPTANIKVDNTDKLIPAFGIYSVKVIIEGETYGGMLYIGDRPSINEQKRRVIEVNVFDFNQNIYEQIIEVRFIEFLRADSKYDDLESLKNQLALDEKAARASLSNQIKTQIEAQCTVAILNYNGEQYLESYLPPMLESSHDHFDILLIDNASTDDSVNYVKEWHPEIQVRELMQNYGFAGGYNKGMQGVKTKYTAIINSDVLVNENWLDPILKRMEEDPSIGAIQPKIRSLEEKQKFEYAGAAGGLIDSLGYPFCRGRIMDSLEEDNGQYDTELEIAWVTGACMVIRTELYQKLEGFDADYFAHHEEIDLCYRIRAAGYKLLCLPSSTVFHLGGGTLDYENPRKTFLNFRNNINTLIKNESWLKLLWLIPIRKVLDFLAFAKFIKEGKKDNAFAIAKAYWAITLGLPRTIKKKRHYKKLIHKNRINHPNRKGLFQGSIVLNYFIKKKKRYSDLIT